MIMLRHGLRVACTVLALMGPMLTLAGCHRDEGPAEKAGKAIDEATHDASDAAHDAVDDLKDAVDDAQD